MTETEIEVFVEPPADWTIFQRMAAIVAEMPAIGKTQRNEQQKFMYRGHDDVMNALNPLLSKYGVFFVPQVLERITDQRSTKSGNVMYEVNLRVAYTFYGPRGDFVLASAWGEGTDSGDKSTNKAMTMALKNVLAQSFAVSTAELSHDTDGDPVVETVGRGSVPTAPARPVTPRPEVAVTDPASKKFRPDMDLAAGAPAGWAEISALILDLDYGLTDWFAEAVQAMYGTSIQEMTDDDMRKRAGRRVANTLSQIRDTLYKDGDFPPPTDDEYRKVFAWGFDGIRVEGPGPTFDEQAALDEQARAAAEGDTSEGAAAGTDGQESDADATAGLAAPEAQAASQGHVGTGEPDL
jgi:hypothetical protein